MSHMLILGYRFESNQNIKIFSGQQFFSKSIELSDWLFLLECQFFVAYCSDFRYESNGIFVLGVGFFFFRQISTF